MASETLTEYERRRLENIQRNAEALANVKRKAAELSAALKRPCGPYIQKPPSKPPPGEIRRSRRTRGISPPSDAVLVKTPPAPKRLHPPLNPKPGQLLIRDAFVGGADSPLSDLIPSSGGPPRQAVEGPGFDPLSSLVLEPENVAAALLPGSISTIEVYPLADRTLVVAGDTLGHVGLWNADSEEGEGVYIYAPHTNYVSGISIHPFSTTKMYTSSNNGLLRLMDVEKETFNMIYSTNQMISALCHVPHDPNCLYFGEGRGCLNVWDERAGNISSSWGLHRDRINSIHFHPLNENFMATSSTDGSVCVWDLRKMNENQPESVRTLWYHRSMVSAFFSPSGNSIAITSLDEKVKMLSGTNYHKRSIVKHCMVNPYSQSQPYSRSRATWGWNDTYLYMGNKKGIGIISVADKSMKALRSPHMTSTPCLFAKHPFTEGTIACATYGGSKIYLWTRS